MSARWNLAALLEPVTPEEPCGKNCEDSGDLTQLDAYQIFGQDTLDAPKPEPGEPKRKEAAKGKHERPPNWAEVGDLAYGMLAKSKDFRALTHLSAALLRTDGLTPFVQTLAISSKWLTDHWAQVYPRVDEEVIFRRNALNAFSDRVAIVDGIRRAVLVSSRAHGRFALRDLEILAGTASPAADEAPPEEARVSAAFAEMPIADLRGLQAAAAEGQAALKAIDEVTRRETNNIEASPDFDLLASQLEKLDAALRARIAAHPDGVAEEGSPEQGGTAASGVIAVGSIRSRQDAIRALEAAAEFFRRNEPSSPIPMLVDRAKRLVSKDFLEVLADVAPEALASAKAAGGIRES